MTTRFVTTCHKAGFDQYGHRLLEGWKHVPGELVWYTEGFDLPIRKNVESKDNILLDDLQAFKRRHGKYVSPYYRWDVVRFAHKVFAVYDALRNHDGIGVWIDADITPYKDVPEGYVESLLEKGDYLAMFRRKGWYSECGFWIVDCNHPMHGEFFDTLIGLYTKDTFKGLREWHDSYLMDVVAKDMERDGRISITNLSGEFSGEEHPMAKVPLAQYLDHAKGPGRKESGVSPENEYRRAA